MEFASITKFHILCLSLLVVFFRAITAARELNHPVFEISSKEECHFPAIFNFGDSNSDTGSMAATTLLGPTPPYGETYFHRPAGRASDGRVLIDFIAQGLGLPYLSGYLDSLGTNFTHGANFAALGATIRPPPSVTPFGEFSPFYLDLQYAQFKYFKSKTQFIRRQGGIFASLMPKSEYFSEALYTFDIGQNDLNIAVSGNFTTQQFNASVFQIVHDFSKNLKNLYHLGARAFWILNIGPVGCIPYYLTTFPSDIRDDYGCVKKYNDLNQDFNHKLKEAVVELRKDLPLAAITYVDAYSVKYSLFSNPKKFGFEDPLVACCGHGGKYNFNEDVQCGAAKQVDATNIFVGSCERPSARVSWDGFHYTEAASDFIFHQISTGAFSDPPLPLNMACHRDSTDKYSASVSY